MVTYCLGSARQKRAYFIGQSNITVLDNVEVLFCASANGRNYFAYGHVPFSEFTVIDYLAYRRALCRDAVTVETVRSFGLDPNKKIERLCATEMRIVSFLEKTAGKSDLPVAVNLDGTKYTRKNAAALERLLSGIATDVYVCVTDAKFLRRAKTRHVTLFFGKARKKHRPKFYTAKILASRINAVRVSVM